MNINKGTKKNHGGFPFSFQRVNHAIETLEKEAMWAYKQFKGALPKNWERRLTQLTSNDIFKLALKKRSQITKEAKRNLQGFVKKIQKSNVAHVAKNLAKTKGNEFLSMLNFPTKKDVSKLNARLSQIEKRLKNLGSRSNPTAH